MSYSTRRSHAANLPSGDFAMKNLFITAFVLVAASHAMAASAVYTTLGIHHTDDVRYPGIMIAIGDDALCSTLSDELNHGRTGQWIDHAVAFIAVRNNDYSFANQSFDVRDDDLTASSSPRVTATAYDFRGRDDSGKAIYSRVVHGQIMFGNADVVNQEPLPVTLTFDFRWWPDR